MGTEEFWVPAVLAAVGTGAQAINQSNANTRAQNAEVQALQNQQQYRQQANDQVKALTQQIAQNSPQQIANQETSQFVNTLRKNEAGTASGESTNFGAPISALAPVAGASSRYNSDVGNAQQQVEQYGNTYAGQAGAIDAAVRQRQNEGLALNTLGTNLNLLGAESAGTGFVNQLRAQAASQANPWVSLFGGVLSQGANSMAKNGWFAPQSTPSQYPSV
jgi:hypothetical protein